MNKLFKFFSASARDLNMQTLTVDQIADKMKVNNNEQAMRLPRSFAVTMRAILDVDAKIDIDNKRVHGRKKPPRDP